MQKSQKNVSINIKLGATAAGLKVLDKQLQRFQERVDLVNKAKLAPAAATLKLDTATAMRRVTALNKAITALQARAKATITLRVNAPRQAAATAPRAASGTPQATTLAGTPAKPATAPVVRPRAAASEAQRLTTQLQGIRQDFVQARNIYESRLIKLRGYKDSGRLSDAQLQQGLRNLATRYQARIQGVQRAADATLAQMSQATVAASSAQIVRARGLRNTLAGNVNVATRRSNTIALNSQVAGRASVLASPLNGGPVAPERVRATTKALNAVGTTGTRALNSATQSAAGLARRLIAVAVAAGGVFATFSRVIRAAGEMSSVVATLNAVLGKQGGAKALKELEAIAERTATPIGVLASSFAGLAASAKGTSLEDATVDIADALATASRAYGLSQEQGKRAVIAVSQSISKGIISAEELRGQLSEAIPGAVNIFARAMGVTTQELNEIVNSGKLGADSLRLFALQLKLETAAGAQQQLRSVGGQIELTKKRFDDFWKQAGKGAEGGLLKALTKVNEALASPAVARFARDIGVGVGKAIGFVGELGVKLLTVGTRISDLIRSEAGLKVLQPIFEGIGGAVRLIVNAVDLAVRGIGDMVAAASKIPGVLTAVDAFRNVYKTANLRAEIDAATPAGSEGPARKGVAGAALTAAQYVMPGGQVTVPFLERLLTRPQRSGADAVGKTTAGGFTPEQEADRKARADRIDNAVLGLLGQSAAGLSKEQIRSKIESNGAQTDAIIAKALGLTDLLAKKASTVDEKREQDDARQKIRDAYGSPEVLETIPKLAAAKVGGISQFLVPSTKGETESKDSAVREARRLAQTERQLEAAKSRTELARVEAGLERESLQLNLQRAQVEADFAAERITATQAADRTAVLDRQELDIQQRILQARIQANGAEQDALRTRAQATSDATERNGLLADLEAAKQSALDLQSEVNTLDNKRAVIDIVLRKDKGEITKEVQDFIAEVEAELQALRGDEAGAQAGKNQQRIDSLRKQYADQPDALASVDRLSVELGNQDRFAAATQAFEQQFDARTRKVQELERALSAGTMTTQQYAQAMGSIDSEAGPALAALSAEIEKLAGTNPQLLAQFDAVKAKMQEVGATSRDLQTQFAQTVAEGFVDSLRYAITEAESFSDAIKMTFRNLFAAIADQLQQQLVQKLVMGLMGTGGGGAGGSSGDGTMSMVFKAIGAYFGFGGFASGGYTGPGGKYQPAGIVHKKEYVIDSDTVSALGVGYFDNLRRQVRSGRGYSAGGYVGAAPAVATLSETAGQSQGLRIVNSLDPSLVYDSMGSSEGERVILNVISRNSKSLRQQLR